MAIFCATSLGCSLLNLEKRFLGAMASLKRCMQFDLFKTLRFLPEFQGQADGVIFLILCYDQALIPCAAIINWPRATYKNSRQWTEGMVPVVYYWMHERLTIRRNNHLVASLVHEGWCNKKEWEDEFGADGLVNPRNVYYEHPLGNIF